MQLQFADAEEEEEEEGEEEEEEFIQNLTRAGSDEKHLFWNP
jgi:hypothetical protein